ncbi:MAG: HD-GYP domain-containing protein, partial [Sedimenticola sp.]
EQIRRSMEQAVQAVALTVEKRDPYTSGHQLRVAELAAAIATVMGLDPDIIRGIHLGGLIHDIGKIYVPSEILNRPGTLSENEFHIIQTHAEVGHDIIGSVEFPWPVKTMIHQHHERLDGSGYPQGLKDGDIILEARILAVADVVEAMASHRPYRPGLGIDSALAEIEKNRGVLYDPDVVDACLKLFREESYSLTKPK